MPEMPGRLYIVSTPIGNLADITQRGLRILREVDLIACEDTRHTRKLLNHYGINTKTVSYHEHNELQRAQTLCELMESGKNIALVSDAGTPLISDPGFRIARRAIDRGLDVVPIPGVSAAVAALTGSGLPSDQFLFAGFLPSRANQRRARLEELKGIGATLIFYEAPHRISRSLQDAREVLGDREAALARELTKIHEEFTRGRLSELAETFRRPGAARGEIVLIVSGAQPDRPADGKQQSTSPGDSLTKRMGELEKEGLDEKAAFRKAARELGLKRDEAYRLLLAQKNRRNR